MKNRSLVLQNNSIDQIVSKLNLIVKAKSLKLKRETIDELEEINEFYISNLTMLKGRTLEARDSLEILNAAWETELKGVLAAA